MNWSPDDVQLLLNEHGRQLFALLVRLTLRVDVAEDLLQELFCKLAGSGGFRKADNRAAYAYRAATNLAFDWRRERTRLPRVERPTESIPGTYKRPLSELVDRENLERTLNAIGDLPETGREIVVSRYLEHQSYEAIAERLGKTTHQVRALCHKALVQLRQRLSEPQTLEAQRGGK